MNCGKCARLEEFYKLIGYLNERKLSFNTRMVNHGLYCEGDSVHSMEMNTITVIKEDGTSWIVRCSLGSCGYELGLLEEEGLLEKDETIGFLTAENIMDLLDNRGRINL